MFLAFLPKNIISYMYVYLIVCWVYILFNPDLDECVKFMKISAIKINDLSILVSVCIVRSSVLCILNCKVFTFSKLRCKTGQDGSSPIYFFKAFSSLWSSSLGFQITCSEKTGLTATLMFAGRTWQCWHFSISLSSYCVAGTWGCQGVRTPVLTCPSVWSRPQKYTVHH